MVTQLCKIFDKIKILLNTFFSVDKFRIKSNLERNKSTSAKTVWNWTTCIGESDSGLFSISPGHHQLCHLLFHKCREGSVWITISFVVKITGSTGSQKCIIIFIQILNFNSYFFKVTVQLEKSDWLLFRCHISIHSNLLLFNACFWSGIFWNWILFVCFFNNNQKY